MTTDLLTELTRAALLGTERQPAPLPSAPGALGEILSALNPDDREATLLSATAVVALYNRCGKIPDIAPDSPTPAEPDELPRCDRIPSNHLGRMLNGENKHVLPEWLTALANSKRRVPEERLPALLDASATDVSLRPALIAVLGHRGRWLAAQNPAWRYAEGAVTESPDEAKEIWENDNKESRIALLNRWRKLDPDRARSFVESTWKVDDPNDRAAFLETLQIGLSPADEPFLETTLDDKRKEVRQVAARHLSQLPESELVRRMIARAEPLLKFSGTHCDVTLPAECDKAMLRDGLQPKPPVRENTLGEKAWWLLQMLGSIPPAHWCAALKTNIESVLSATIHSEWRPLFDEAFATAAARFRDAQWAVALLQLCGAGVSPARAAGTGALQGLIALLPPEACEARALELVRTNSSADDLLNTLNCCQTNWTPQFTRAVLNALKRIVAQNVAAGTADLRGALKTFASKMAPSLAQDATEGWNDASPSYPYWRKQIDEMTEILHFRNNMLEALKTN